jgi:NTE family protein
MRHAWQRHRIAVASLLLLGACTGAGVEINAPLRSATEAAPPPGTAYRLPSLEQNNVHPGTLILLAFTGGGKRSAAYSYGALRGLADTRITVGSATIRLLDQVSMISGVSGGSFTAAYYGLYRDKIFTDFERDFLKRDIEAYIYGTYLLPWNWRWAMDANYGTNDRMAEAYDALMFHGARYEDLLKRGRPMIVLQATDVSFGAVFPFTQEYFDLICSDLLRYPIARAVAASNGFPILFTPITLENHAARCRGRVPAWIRSAEAVPDRFSIRRHLAEQGRRYLDAEKTRFIHLLDGGIADNLAMRGYIELMTRNSTDLRELPPKEISELMRIRRILVLSIDGQAAADSRWPQRRSIGGISQIFAAVSGTQIDRYNLDTVNLMRESLERVKGSLIRVRCRAAKLIDGQPCNDVQVFFDQLALSGIRDESVRNRLALIPTGLTLDSKDVDLLIESGRKAVVDSSTIRQFVDSYRIGARVSYRQ